ncbi:prepilin peptidase [Pseudomonas tritici]|uniref:prepilin peptidase n=1 Tax=Pseudomonas tritici TaxID=2745518 RepID=UPI00387AC6B5
MIEVSAMSNGWLIALWFSVVGACIGSFANVVCHRLPIIRGLGKHSDGARLQRLIAKHGKYTLSHPRSSCPCCDTRIKIRYNVPVIGWVLSRGKCSACKKRIPFMYPGIELLFAIAFGAYTWFEGLSLAGSMSFVMMFAGYCFIMIRHQTGRFDKSLVAVYLLAFVLQLGLTSLGFSGY